MNEATLNDFEKKLNVIVRTGQMTKENHDTLIVVKDGVNNLFGQKGISSDSIMRLRLAVYNHLNKMEKYYKENGYKWK